ncbi:N-6 DNA methylase [Empedobacter falsenii]
MGTESEEDFNGLFQDVDLASSKLGKTPNKRNEVIVEILGKLAEIDFKLNEIDSDILGDAYEYLISNFAAGTGKSAGEFYTPQLRFLHLVKTKFVRYMIQRVVLVRYCYV